MDTGGGHYEHRTRTLTTTASSGWRCTQRTWKGGVSAPLRDDGYAARWPGPVRGRRHLGQRDVDWRGRAGHTVPAAQFPRRGRRGLGVVRRGGGRHRDDRGVQRGGERTVSCGSCLRPAERRCWTSTRRGWNRRGDHRVHRAGGRFVLRATDERAGPVRRGTNYDLRIYKPTGPVRGERRQSPRERAQRASGLPLSGIKSRADGFGTSPKTRTTTAFGMADFLGLENQPIRCPLPSRGTRFRCSEAGGRDVRRILG